MGGWSTRSKRLSEIYLKRDSSVAGMESLEYAQALLSKHHLDFWDLREETAKTLQMRAWNGVIKDCTFADCHVMCVRVLTKGALGFASTDATDALSLNRAITDAVNMAQVLSPKIKERKEFWIGKAVTANVKSSYKIHPDSISLEKKKQLLLDQTMNDSTIQSQQYNYTEQIKNSVYANSVGSAIDQQLIYTHLSASVTMNQGRVESFDTRHAGLGGFEIAKHLPKTAQEAVDGVKLLLRAKSIKGAMMPVVTDSALTDVFVHEAVDHAAEADIVLQKDSYLEHAMGKKLAPSFVTIIDSGLGGHWGSFFYDEEGVKSQKTKIIDHGVLRSLLHNRESAKHFGVAPTGNGRAQDARHLPQVRMRWTYLEPQDQTQEELIEQVKSGVLLCGSKGGQVNTSKGSFQFSAQYGYLIKNGRLTDPVREVGLGGIAMDILRSIKGVSKDMPGTFPGYCGKGGQSVPVGGPCPSILIGRAMVGGGS
jgi:TldD protein